MHDISSILYEIITFAKINEIRIKNLDKIKIPKNFKENVMKEFLNETKNTNVNFRDLYQDLLKLYELYFKGLKLMDVYLNNFNKFYSYPKEERILSEFIKIHWTIKLMIYNAGTKEKNYAEERLEYSLNSALDSVSYFLMFFGDIVNSIEKLEDAIKLKDERGEILYYALLGSEEAFKTLKNIFSRTLYERNEYKIIDKDILINQGFKILVLDNTLEELWHYSGISMLDLGFYYLISKKYNKNSIHELIEHLNLRSKREKVRLPISFYYQYYDSCGVVSLLNAIKVYKPSVKLNRKIERDLMEKVRYKDYPGNLAPLLVKIAKERFNIEAKMFFDIYTYVNSKDKVIEIGNSIGYDKEKILDVMEFFIRSAKEVGYIKKNEWSKDEIEELLNNGSMIIFAKDFNNIFHYNLIFGYDKENFFIFDPIYGEYRIKKEEISKIIKNKLGMWGLITYPPNNYILDEMERHSKISKEIIKSYGIEYQ